MSHYIRDKYEMYDALNRGFLGHTLPAAETLPDVLSLIASLPVGTHYAIRYKIAGHKTQYHLTSGELVDKIALEYIKDGTFNASPMLVNEHRVCYAHLIDSVDGWNLYFSTEQKPCKLMPSLDGCTPRHLFRSGARVYLRSIMDDIGWDNLERLIEHYPAHVIEFTVMTSRHWAYGESNTVFWEVRNTSTEYERYSGYFDSVKG